MDHFPIHEKQVESIDQMAVTMAQIANNVLWITNIGKWALGVAGVVIVMAITLAADFNDKLQDVSVSVKSSEVRITGLIRDQERDRW